MTDYPAQLAADSQSEPLRAPSTGGAGGPLLGLTIMTMLLGMAAVTGAAEPSPWPGTEAVFQYAVPALDHQGKPITAYLWLPPQADRIRGVLVGGVVVFEGSFATHPAVRAACAEAKLAIVLFAPHLDAVFDAVKSAPLLEKALADLAAASGRGELATAPLMPYGHSVGTIWTRNVLFWNPARCFGAVFFKGSFGVPAGHQLAEIRGIPLLQIQGQFEEFGPGPSGTLRADEDRSAGAQAAMHELAVLRAQEPSFLIGLLVEEGSTHFPLSDRVAERIAAFVRGAAERRIPARDGEAGSPPPLLTVAPASGGWSGCDPFRPASPAAAASDYRGDPAQSFWHCDGPAAVATDAFHAGALTSKPQFVSFADGKGEPQAVGDDMRLKLAPNWVGSDTFRVAGTFLTAVPRKYPAVPGTVAHADGPVRFRIFSGPLQRVAADTFRVTMDHRAGARAYLLAYHDGDGEYRHCEQPASLRVPERLTEGRPQSIAFTGPGTVPASALPLTLQASSDSGLPVSFHVDHGPARVHDGRLELAEVPADARWPLTVEVVAWQYGSAVEPKVQSAESVRRTVTITARQ